MKLLLIMAATRAFVVVSPETPADAAAAARVEHELLAAARKAPKQLFRIMAMGKLLRGGSAGHVKPRKEAEKLLSEARLAYGELDLEKAVTLLRSAQIRAEAGLASRSGLSTYLSIQLELGLRLWELEDPNGEGLLASGFALDPALELPPGTQLNESMKDRVEMMRMDPKLDQSVAFRSPVGAIVMIGDRNCTTPCSIDPLPSGAIPWRATIPGYEPMGGLARGGDTVVLQPEVLGDHDRLVASWARLWKSSADDGADVLSDFAERARAASEADLIWLVIGAERIAMIRAQVRPEPKLLHRIVRSGAPLKGDALVSWVGEQLAGPQTVAAPARRIGPMAAVSTWLRGLKMPDLRPSKRTLIVTGATVAAVAIATGVAVAVANSPQPSVSYDPVLGF